MKTYLSLVLITFLFIANGCVKHRVLNTLDGTWQIVSIRYSGGSLPADSVVNYENKYIQFEKCTVKDNKNLNNCQVHLQENNENYPFAFKVNRSERNTTLGIFALPQEVPDDGMEEYINSARHFVGWYEIITLDDHNMKIICYDASVTNLAKINDYNIREIVAER